VDTTGSIPGISIRRFRPDTGGDRAAMRRIFRATGLLGGPVARYFPDPEFMADAMLSYYLRFERDWALVAEEVGTGAIAGYITGCPDTAVRNRISPRWLFPRVAASFVRRGLLFSRAGVEFAVRALPTYLREMSEREGLPTAREYPAHLHMAVDPAFQRRGIGRALLNALLDRFGEAGVRGVHIETSNKHAAAVALYRQLGFEEFARQRTRLFDHMMPEHELPVEWILMARRIGDRV
jgi:ribosomal protein S18 acetylase RimI-like enzyme